MKYTLSMMHNRKALIKSQILDRNLNLNHMWFDIIFKILNILDIKIFKVEKIIIHFDSLTNNIMN